MSRCIFDDVTTATEIFLDHKGINYLPEDLLHLQMKLDILEGKQENQEIQATGGEFSSGVHQCLLRHRNTHCALWRNLAEEPCACMC